MAASASAEPDAPALWEDFDHALRHDDVDAVQFLLSIPPLFNTRTAAEWLRDYMQSDDFPGLSDDSMYDLCFGPRRTSLVTLLNTTGMFEGDHLLNRGLIDGALAARDYAGQLVLRADTATDMFGALLQLHEDVMYKAFFVLPFLTETPRRVTAITQADFEGLAVSVHSAGEPQLDQLFCLEEMLNAVGESGAAQSTDAVAARIVAALQDNDDEPLFSTLCERSQAHVVYFFLCLTGPAALSAETVQAGFLAAVAALERHGGEHPRLEEVLRVLLAVRGPRMVRAAVVREAGMLRARKAALTDRMEWLALAPYRPPGASLVRDVGLLWVPETIAVPRMDLLAWRAAAAASDAPPTPDSAAHRPDSPAAAAWEDGDEVTDAAEEEVVHGAASPPLPFDDVLKAARDPENAQLRRVVLQLRARDALPDEVREQAVAALQALPDSEAKQTLLLYLKEDRQAAPLGDTVFPGILQAEELARTIAALDDD